MTAFASFAIFVFLFCFPTAMLSLRQCVAGFQEKLIHQSDLAPRFTNTVATPLVLGANVKS